MLILIPTYKRLTSLEIVVQSALACDLPEIGEKPRLAIVNNYPPHKEAVQTLIDNIWKKEPRSANWELIIIHRETTIPQIDNWYSAVSQLAKEGEMFIIQGDDDLFTSNSLFDRWQSFKNTKADLLLTHSYSGLTYLKGDSKIHFTNLEQIRNTKVSLKNTQLDFTNFENYSPVFIGSQAYIYNEKFIAALKLTGDWANEQAAWLDYHHRTVMYPYYLVLSYLHLNYNVVGLDSFCCIRGTSLEEKLGTQYNSSRGWNSGFLSMVVLDIFHNKDLIKSKNKMLTSHNLYLGDAANWYLTAFIDKRVDKKSFNIIRQKIKVPLGIRNYVFNARVILQQHLGLKYIGLRIMLLFNKHVFSSKFLIEEVTKNNKM